MRPYSIICKMCRMRATKSNHLAQVKIHFVVIAANCICTTGLNIGGYNQHYWAFEMLTMALQLKSCESSSKKTILL